MYRIIKTDEGVVFDNLLPQLRSRHGYFPGAVVMEDGCLLVSFALGEAMESVDLTTVLARSSDGGRSWEMLPPVIDKTKFDIPLSNTMKMTYLGNDRMIAIGYAFPRPDESLPIGNPETGGALDDFVIFAESKDRGRTWSDLKVIKSSFDSPVEASAPITVLSNGWWASPIANFAGWDGVYAGGPCGRLLLSKDQGENWDDGTVTMRFSEGPVTVFEQRICQLDDGRIVVIAWNEDIESGRLLSNHYAVSNDCGLSFGAAAPTGIKGQTSSVMSLGGSRILSLHCIRRDSDQPGIYACLVDLADGKWDILAQEKLWGPDAPARASANMAKVFSYLRFGQPSAVKISDGGYFMVNWVIEEGQGRIVWHKFDIKGLA